ncbi:hypothetical protein [Paracoccus jiaweipingae]|uniref:hypothetical protein n=1 Tax=unclassified Paracoccus (in: a-proteobacteria) TaxID=2688777 RepID=UPI0037923DBC
MFNKTLKAGLIAGKIAALTAIGSTVAMAQSGAVVTPSPMAETAVIPADALKKEAPVGQAAYTGFPSFDQQMNDQAVADTLLAQGFSDIHILRDGTLMTVTAQRDGKDIELLYNLVEGRLIKVNGERVDIEKGAGPDGGSSTPGVGGTQPTAPGDSDDGMDDGDASDDGAPDGDTGSDDAGGDDTDTGTDTGDNDTDDSGSGSASDSSDDAGSDDSGSDSDSGSDDSNG